jgi:putative solute:sodium symporter small subunit
MEAPNDYNFSIFNPVNEYSRRNRNIILSILVLWIVCIFGFQFLLLIVQKPTPEKALTVYESVADNVFAGQASVDEKKAFNGALLMVLGKTIKPDDRALLDRQLTQIVYDLLPDSAGKAAMIDKLAPLALKRAELASLNEAWEKKTIRFQEFKNQTFSVNEEIVRMKGELGSYLSSVADQLIPADDKFRIVMLIWLPHELKIAAITDPQPVDKEKLDQVMKLYLTHNQSFLTDFRFLGFPFHYFYTAVFLLVFFVGLCMLYAYRIEHLHKKFNMEV